ncbi:zinc-dependent metalloprotease [Gordonia jinhuaensis]|nr:zinc-dependent metalloprotease [Gordonia jinhuaensis]
MNDMPFGFSPSPGDDDDDRRKDDKSSGGSSSSGSGGTPNNPFGFNLGGDMGGAGFDPSQLGQMLSQLGQMISGMGSGMATGGSGGGPVNYSVAGNLARQQIGDFTPVSDGERTAVTESVRLAELWLDDATTLPAGATRSEAWTPVEWMEAAMPTFKRLCDPVAQQISNTWSTSMPEEMAQMAGPMMGMLTQMGGMAFGTQLGQGLGQLAKEVLTSTDIGLPIAPAGTAALLPEAIARFDDGLEIPSQEVMVFLAAREAAYVRLFTHVPWLRERLLATVEEYARGITIDFSGIERAATEIDPMQLLSDPSKIEELMASGTSFEPTTTEEQKAALGRLETLLALVEGWVEQVVGDALSDRIPSTAALTETMRRRRATGGPAEQTFATLVGLELRPRKLREASTLWQRVKESTDTATRDGVWAHPDLLPDGDDIDNPAAFIDRLIGGDTTSFEEAFAELEKSLADDDTDAIESGDQPPTESDSSDGGAHEEPGDTDPDAGDTK